jgi:hypothetical protein
LTFRFDNQKILTDNVFSVKNADIRGCSVQEKGPRICPFCTREIAENAASCRCCGEKLHSLKIAHPCAQSKERAYRIVPDGVSFAISLGDDIKLHGLDLEKAHELVSILNSIVEDVSA